MVAEGRPGDPFRAVAGAVRPRHLFGQGRFVPGTAAEFLETQGHGVQVRSVAFRRQADDGRRIQARGKKHADRHIGHQVMAHAVRQRRPQVRRRPVRTFGERLRDVEIAVHAPGPRGIHPQGVARRQGADGPVKRVRLRHIAEQEESHVPGRIRRAIHPAAAEQRLDLGGDAEGLAVVGVIERLDAEGIARQEKALLRLVPQGKRIHAAQLVHHVGAQGVVQVQKHFRVRLGGEDATLGFQALAQGAEVIDLAVVGDAVAPVCEVHGLGRGLAEVDDGEATMGQPDAAVGGDPCALAVGAAGAHGLAKRHQLGPLHVGGVRAVGEYGGDPAHGQGYTKGRRS